MSENKTRPTELSVDEYIAQIEHAGKREDALTLRAMIEELTGEPAKMWGPTMIGSGQYHYKYESGREGDMFLAGFAPRKANLVAYVIGEIPEQQELLNKLGKHKIGRACLYMNKLADVDLDVLRKLYERSIEETIKKYGRVQ